MGITKGTKLSDEWRAHISEGLRGKKKPPGFHNSGMFQKGQSAWNYKGRYKRADGYIDVLMPDHPRSHGHKGAVNRYVFEHVLVMEEHLGRYLVPPENVHHINHIRDDNRIENLRLCANNAEHKRQHVQTFPDGTKSCSVCKEVKPLDQFPFRKCNPQLMLQRRFYGSWCYPCCRAKRRVASKTSAGA